MEYRTTREIVQDLRSLNEDAKLSVLLIDVGDNVSEYMHHDGYSAARKLFSLNDICQTAFDYDQLYEATQAHVGSRHGQDVIEDAFVEALEFAEKIQSAAGTMMHDHIHKANGYYVGGISCRGQLVVGVYR